MEGADQVDHPLLRANQADNPVMCRVGVGDYDYIRLRHDLAADGSKPEGVAAEHWVRSFERLLADKDRLASCRYLEVYYESVTESPETVLDGVWAFADLPHADRLTDALRRRAVRSGSEKYNTQLEEGEVRTVEQIVAPLVTQLGHQVDGAGRQENG